MRSAVESGPPSRWAAATRWGASRGGGSSWLMAPPSSSGESCGVARPDAAEDGQLQPLEVAVGLVVADLPQPAHLGLDRLQDVVGLVGPGVMLGLDLRPVPAGHGGEVVDVRP